MKRFVLGLSGLSLIMLLFTQCKASSKTNEISLENKSLIDLKDKAISIDRSYFKKFPEGILYPIIKSSKGDTIPAQLDDLDGDNSWDQLFFVINLASKEKSNFTLNWVVEKPKFNKRTSVRFGKRMSATATVQPADSEVLTAKELPKSLGFQRYQTDGPSWENDKVGFRHYLDGRNAKDLFGKKVSYISPKNVGINKQGAVEDNYHVMEDWGRDVLAVGNSLGIGGYGLQLGNKLLRLGVTVNDSINNVEKTSFKIMAEGPVRSVLNYNYKNWNTAGRTYNVVENTAIWPGIYGYQNSVKISGIQGDENLVVGLVNINTETALKEILANDKFVVLYTHDKQTYDKEWWLGMALILPKDLYEGFIEAPKTGQLSNTFLAKLKIENNKVLKYYAIACWELSDKGFSDKDYFLNYIRNLTDQLAAEVEVVTVK